MNLGWYCWCALCWCLLWQYTKQYFILYIKITNHNTEKNIPDIDNGSRYASKSCGCPNPGSALQQRWQVPLGMESANKRKRLLSFVQPKTRLIPEWWHHSIIPNFNKTLMVILVAIFLWTNMRNSVIQRRLYNFRTVRQLLGLIIGLPNFTKSYNKTSYEILKQPQKQTSLEWKHLRKAKLWDPFTNMV